MLSLQPRSGWADRFAHSSSRISLLVTGLHTPALTSVTRVRKASATRHPPASGWSIFSVDLHPLENWKSAALLQHTPQSRLERNGEVCFQAARTDSDRLSAQGCSHSGSVHRGGLVAKLVEIYRVINRLDGCIGLTHAFV